MSEEKHQLQTGWTLLYDVSGSKTQKSSDSWGESQRVLLTVNTIEDFWGLFNNIQKPTQLSNGSNYYFFRDGIKPAWEDPSNAKGGRWIIEMDQKSDMADQCWLTSLLALIGENIDNVCGIVLNLRRNYLDILFGLVALKTRRLAFQSARNGKSCALFL